MKKKKFKKSKRKKTNLKTASILPVLFVIFLMGLFSETVKTLPVGATSEYLEFFNVPKLNITSKEDKLNELFIIDAVKPNIKAKTEEKLAIKEKPSRKEKLLEKKNKKIKKIEQDIQNIQTKISKVQKEITEIELKKLDQEKEIEVIVAKASKTPVEEIVSKSVDQKTIDQKIVDVPKIEETIKMAADTSTKTITIEGEEKIIPGSSDKNITYIQILQNPNDLDLNLKYAKQQGEAGNFKQTIATLERLNMLYPDNIEIKLYLLSVLVQADSPNKALTIIEDVKTNPDLTPEDLLMINQIEEEMKARGAPKLWNFYADIGLGGTQNNNVGSVSKTRTQISSDSLIGMNGAKFDRTYNGSLGLTATRILGEASSFMLNLAGTDSNQEQDTGDDFQSYGLTLALDTVYKNQSLSPYFMLSKTDYQDDADSFSIMGGIGGSFSFGDRHSFSYGYSFSDAKGNNNSSDTTADATNAIGHGVTVGHDFMLNEIISISTGAGYSESDAMDQTNDFETYDLNFRLNFALPQAYISIGESFSFNDYKNVDSSVTTSMIRSDYTATSDIMLTKAVGDLLPIFDPNKNLFFTLSFEKLISEANIKNYDYIADSFSVSLSKNFHLNK